MRSNKYLNTAGSLYVNYFIFGMVNIMLASHMSFLTKQFHTDKAGISFLVAAMGMGRLFTLYLSGVLSDKFGRKPFIILAVFLYAIFLVGMPLCPSYQIAIVLAILAGVANSLLDSGTYPALMEVFPKSPGTATVFVRGVISIGSMLLPLMIVYFMDHDIYYGISFFLPAIIFIISGIFLLKMKFPTNGLKVEKAIQKERNNSTESKFYNKPKFWFEGLCLILIGFTGPALLYIIQLWLPTFGQQVIGMTESSSLKLLSYYSIGSLVSVAVLVMTLHKFVKPVTVVLLYPLISIISLVILITFKSPIVTIISSFLIGFSISGVLQLALTVMSEFFSEKKGQITGFIYTATSLAYTLIPLITGNIQKNGSVTGVFTVAIIINFIGIVLAGLVLYRYGKVFNTNSIHMKMGPLDLDGRAS